MGGLLLGRWWEPGQVLSNLLYRLLDICCLGVWSLCGPRWFELLSCVRQTECLIYGLSAQRECACLQLIKAARAFFGMSWLTVAWINRVYSPSFTGLVRLPCYFLLVRVYSRLHLPLLPIALFYYMCVSVILFERCRYSIWISSSICLYSCRYYIPVKMACRSRLGVFLEG